MKYTPAAPESLVDRRSKLTLPRIVTPQNIIYLGDGRFRVRIYHQGETHGNYHRNLADAVAERDAIRAAIPARVPKHDISTAEHLRQVAALPEGTNWTRNISRIRQGYRVNLSRGREAIYGGLYGGPDGLVKAIARRDALELKFPRVR